MEIRKGRRVVSSLHAHRVFVTKRRAKVFNIAHLKRLEEICRDVCCDFEAELKEFNGERDHVHLLVICPPKVRLSELVNSLKGVSSRRLKVELSAISTFWNVRKSEGSLWCPSYFVGSVGGAPIEILRHHIEKQGRSESPA
jgi:putative transposase